MKSSPENSVLAPRQLNTTVIRCASLILFCLPGSICGFAQMRSLDVSQYLHKSWTVQDGFFRGGVTAIAQTSDGYLWLTSSSGLLRFDGVRFEEWHPPANESLPGNPLFSLLASRDGSLWIGGQGLAELTADGKFHRYHELDQMSFSALIEDKDGAVWAGGISPHGISPLCRVDHGQSQYYGDQKSFGNWIGALYEDRSGRLLAGTEKGIWRIQHGQPEEFSPYPSVVRTFAEDASGTLLVADYSGINVLSGDGKIKSYPATIDGQPIQAHEIMKDQEGNLWIGTMAQGLVHIHQGRTDRFTTLDGLSFDSTQKILQDREGSVWVVSGNGVDRFTKPAIPRITHKQGLPSDDIFSVVSGKDDVSWIGTPSGLAELSGDRVTKSAARLPNESIKSLFETSTGHLLVTTNTQNGMVWLEGKTAVPLRVKSGENSFTIAEDRNGDLWVSNRETGLMHLRGNGDVIQIYKWRDLKIGGMALAYDPGRDGLWLASPDGNLGFFKDGRILERYVASEGLGQRILRDPQVDSDGGVWVSTGSGLARLMNGKISTLGRNNGLPCDRVFWMRHDNDHNIWLYAECGLVSFPEKDLSSWIVQPSHVVSVTNYLDNTEGVENTPINGWYTPQVTKTSDGRILFAMSTGLAVLDPSHLNRNTLPPQVHIEEITADGQKFEGIDHISLPKRVHSIHFNYAAMSFVAPQKVQFRYQLEGYDTKWSDPVSLREVTYTNLPPGHYVFRVMACNNDGVWNESGTALAFIIPPAFAQTVWFKAACVLAIFGCIFLAYRLRVQQLSRQLRVRMYERLAERTRIAQELHDTLLQSFQGLMLRFQGANEIILSNPSEAKEALEGALESADQALTESRQAIQGIRTDRFSDRDIEQALRNIMNDLAADEQLTKGKRPTTSVLVEGKPQSVDPGVGQEICKVAREAFRNAFTHGNAQHIESEIAFSKGFLRVRFRDDGVGMDSVVLKEEVRAGHWGLTGMKERAKRLRGQLNMWSKPGAGTEVELTVPAHVAFEAGLSWFPFKKTGGEHAVDV
jgi:signal transduction histidine kinase/ligand-binding sensor domain-containing protein